MKNAYFSLALIVHGFCLVVYVLMASAPQRRVPLPEYMLANIDSFLVADFVLTIAVWFIFYGYQNIEKRDV